MGIARENVRLSYRMVLRKIRVREAVWQQRMAIASAGIYENAADHMSDASLAYLNALDFAPDEEGVKRRQTDLELYEEWKSIFGKMDEET
jgi:hypothetical protein